MANLKIDQATDEMIHDRGQFRYCDTSRYGSARTVTVIVGSHLSEPTITVLTVSYGGTYTSVLPLDTGYGGRIRFDS
jgi:hypothetical protein